MTYQLKLLNWPDTGNHLIAISRGSMNQSDFRDLFAQIVDVTQPIENCKVLIDLEETSFAIGAAEFPMLVDELKAELRPEKIKIAMVAGAAEREYDQLVVLSTYLSTLGLKVSVFFATNAAISWLAEPN